MTSGDGTRIAFERTGQGSPVILVDGAMGFRGNIGLRPLATELSGQFTVVAYAARMAELLDAGRRDEAVEFFTDMLPPAMIGDMKRSPEWALMWAWRRLSPARSRWSSSRTTSAS